MKLETVETVVLVSAIEFIISLYDLLDKFDYSIIMTGDANITYTYISTKNTAFVQSFVPQPLKDWNTLDKENTDSTAVILFKNKLWFSSCLAVTETSFIILYTCMEAISQERHSNAWKNTKKSI